MMNTQRKHKWSIEPDDGHCDDRSYNNRPWSEWEKERDLKVRLSYPGLREMLEIMEEDNG